MPTITETEDGIEEENGELIEEEIIKKLEAEYSRIETEARNYKEINGDLDMVKNLKTKVSIQRLKVCIENH